MNAVVVAVVVAVVFCLYNAGTRLLNGIFGIKIGFPISYIDPCTTTTAQRTIGL